jgi:xanthine phosphoribosyltransferase
MRPAQKILIEQIKKCGEVNGQIVKVDRLLNHLVDIRTVKAIGEDIAEHFRNSGADKILTVEASGIPPAQAAASCMNIDYIFAKKKNPITMKYFFCAESYSFTKNEHTTLYISKEVLHKGDKILFVDDFYAQGNTLNAIKQIIQQAEAELVGCAVVIDKVGIDEVHSILTLDMLKEALGQ